MEKDDARAERNIPREEKVSCFLRYDYNVGHGVLRAIRLEERRRNTVCGNGVF